MQYIRIAYVLHLRFLCDILVEESKNLGGKVMSNMIKLLSIILSCMMLWALVLPIQAYATEVTTTTDTVVTTVSDLQTALNNGGTIILGADIGGTGPLMVKENSALDLNGYKLSVITKSIMKNGILIEIGKTLTIKDSKWTAKKSGNGKLYVKGSTGIQTTGATLIIDSGVVEATGQFGAGIGGDRDYRLCDGGTVIINDGEVLATGGTAGTYGGAGIGGVEDGNGGTVTINGGEITAIGGLGAGIGGGGTAGIGGGHGGTITITGGTVTALGGGWSTGIGGGGSNKNMGTISITGGTIKATGSSKDYDIGSGSNKCDNGSLNITGGTLELTSINRGTNAINPYFANCTIKGEGAGNFKGVYDAKGIIKSVNITFDSNGGKIDKEVKLIVKNICIRNMKLPKAPIRNGYIFKGWYTKKVGGTRITKNTVVPLTKKTYYAQWTKKK